MATTKEKTETPKAAAKEKPRANDAKRRPDEKKSFFSLKKKKEPLAQIQKPLSDPFDVIRFVLMTEKSVRMVELQNKLVFIVRRSAKKDMIKKAVEQTFESPVVNVSTVIDQSGRKKAFVKFKNAGAAGDIAIKLGVI